MTKERRRRRRWREDFEDGIFEDEEQGNPRQKLCGVYWVCIGCVLGDIWHSGYMPYIGWYFGYYYYYYYYYYYCLLFNPIVGCLLLSVELYFLS